MTSSVALIQRLHQHRAWVNDNLLISSSALTDEQLRRPFPIGQGSIWRSLVHLYAAEYHWLEALLGNENPLVQGDLRGHLPGNQLGSGGIATFAELQKNWLALQKRWERHLSDLQPASLADPVYKISTSSNHGQRFATRRFDVLLHVCTHAQYTTAQVVNMLRQLGVEKLPDTMLITLARQESA